MTEEVDFISTESKVNMVDGILHFENREHLKLEVNRIENQDDASNTRYFNGFYANGFSPLYPRYDQNDDKSFNRFFELRKENAPAVLKNLNDLEIDDDLISDDYFASFLNNNREVVVSDTLYRYTHHGTFKTHYTNIAALNQYITTNQVSVITAPDPNTVQRGTSNVTNDIVVEIPIHLEDPCSTNPSSVIASPIPYTPLEIMMSDCVVYSPSPNSPGSNTSVNHKQNLINYTKNLPPCDVSNVGLWGWTIFGAARKCYSYHNDDNRVKTKYWDEDYMVYASIGVKVKHQYKGWLGWRTKDTDEVALTINRAFFSRSVGNSVPGTTPFLSYINETNRLFYIADAIYPNDSRAMHMLFMPYNGDSTQIPKTPFTEDIIIQDFIDLPLLGSQSIELEADQVNRFFWSSAWQTARSLMLTRTGREPDKITYILTTPQKVYITYIDLDRRKLNTNKIVNRLDYDWGAEVKFTINFGGDGSISTNFDNFNDHAFDILRKSFSAANLAEFDDISMDFVGATRMGNTWKGSRIVYNK
jgi:hypothetical protein